MIEKYNHSLKNQWNDVLLKSSNESFMFRRDFVEYHKQRFQDHSVIIDKKFLFPANEQDFVIYSHGGLSYGGLLAPRGVKLAKYLSAFYELLSYYKDLGYQRIVYKQTPSIYLSEFQGAEEYALFLSGAVLFRRDTNVVVNLEKDPKFSERKKRNIKKAENLEFRLDHNDSALEEYWEKILVPCLSEAHGVAPTHSLREILLLKEKFPANIEFEGVYKDKKMIGGVLWFLSGKVMHSQYIASNEECRQLGGLDRLFGNIIDGIDFSGNKYLSFGVCNEEQGKKLNLGLSAWKEEFSGEIVPHNFYVIDLSNDFNLLKNNLG